MADERLRELERRWQESGAREDEHALLLARERVRPSLAVLCCVHGNLEALEAVLADVDHRGIRRVVCLGDVVGYGPSPVECLDLIRARCEVALKGNHDEATLHGAYNFGLWARQVVEWTQELLRPGLFSGATRRARWRWLEQLPERHAEGPDLFVHGSPRDPINEYILPMDVHYGPTEKVLEIFASFERLLFVGHSHTPGLVTEDFQHRTPAELDQVWDYPGSGKAIVNVGSVGQPRDRDPRACYAIFDGARITWRRIEYDLERTIARIQANPRIPPAYVQRMREAV